MKVLLRSKRSRAKTKGSASRPRLSVFRSNRFVYTQIIDDEKGVTLVSANEKELKLEGKAVEKAKELGLLIAKKAKAAKISAIVFDRGSYKYHGRVKQIAEGAREGGLKF
ncbi:MAG: 50S ribosomal protein L18 [Candidatus Levybacteria bacterium RIFCSPLOWO2_01_FULL_36_13]|nr:MAG: 50S ribosomal protein L18 [Candidatus Levybacteria bacterium RIFCSPHIGHO2_01_FULL_36_15b]OGH35029.1 MAG: 50S ribosomal protein L18 [Candidatus Levybacteria bacterium RIFCSPLOWO2_01_FULL_36_13]